MIDQRTGEVDPEYVVFEQKHDRLVEAEGQVRDLREALDVPKDRYLHLPYKPVDDLVGGIRPGSLVIPVAFSGDGKSSFIMSSLERWLNQGLRVAYMGLETKPWKLRVHLACRQLDVDPGDVITGKILEQPDGERVRQQVKEAANELITLDWASRIKFFPQTFIGHKELDEVAIQVTDMEADVWVIDHVDQVEGGDGSNAFAESRRALNKLFELKQQLDLTIVALSQLNNDAVRSDPMARYRPAQPNMVYMGGHKRMISDVMLSIYRPLKLMPKDIEGAKGFRDRLKDARQQLINPTEMLMQNTMAISIMKHREYGNREGQRCYLHIARGKVRELELNEAAARGLLAEKY